MQEHTLEILLAHNAWATRRLLESCASLSDRQLHERFDIGPGSLHDTLLHIAGAMQRWSDRIAGGTLRPSPEKQGRRWSIAELRELLDEAHQSLSGVARQVCAAGELEAEMTAEFSDGQVLRFSKAAALVHVTTHGVHHRAQALNMQRRLGVIELVDHLDVIDWAIQAERTDRALESSNVTG